MGWMRRPLASGPARKALGMLLTTITITLFLLNLRRAGARFALADRLRDGRRRLRV